MPRVTISISAPSQALDGELLTLDLPPGLTIGDLKGFVHAETQLAPNLQQFYLNGQPVHGDAKTLEELGIKDGEMLAMLVRQPEPQSNSNMGAPRTQHTTARSRPSQRAGRPTPDEIETTRLKILGSPAAIAQVREQHPELAEVVNDATRFRAIFENVMRDQDGREQERLNQMRLLNEDPFNVDAQRRIEEMIRQQSVQENLQHAYEHNPEVFGRVTMLYIHCMVNKHPVKAFVDSGAQTTIMSPSCAEDCGIMRLIDTRYSGVAKGDGTAKILGRVHSAQIEIGNAIMPCSFTVMEGKDVDLLLGLDMLKRFQGIIDLRRSKLIMGDGNEVDFLGEAEIPKQVGEAQDNEPTISGPNGTEIGAQTGTVKPAGSAAAAAASSSSSQQTGAFNGQGQALGAASSSSSRTPVADAPAPAAAQRSSRPEHPKEKIDQLEGLGFTRSQAISALDACDGNVEYAAGFLFSG